MRYVNKTNTNQLVGDGKYLVKEFENYEDGIEFVRHTNLECSQYEYPYHHWWLLAPGEEYQVGEDGITELSVYVAPPISDLSDQYEGWGDDE